ncbi:MAG: hypothetical protein KGI05_05060 [Thaumarchaeota archaeon]|nr:hypothetical protein [Nitrososphaerota archaeon]
MKIFTHKKTGTSKTLATFAGSTIFLLLFSLSGQSIVNFASADSSNENSTNTTDQTGSTSNDKDQPWSNYQAALRQANHD